MSGSPLCTWYSLALPKPPWVSTAASQARKPASPAEYFAAFAAAPQGRPWSWRQAA
jgi:hypothetical protein